MYDKLEQVTEYCWIVMKINHHIINNYYKLLFKHNYVPFLISFIVQRAWRIIRIHIECITIHW